MTVAVALSGGADSLLGLFLVRQSGVNTLAVHARFLPNTDQTLEQSLKKTCQALEVDLVLVDLRQAFDDLVVTPFVRAYQNGLTPNPCAACNPAIKFGLLLDRVMTLGAATLATGHYARLEQTPNGALLFRGQDLGKDQSYFLSCVPSQRLAQVQFPLAGWTKENVRNTLTQHGLTPPAKKESQEICFIPEDYRNFLSGRNVPLGGPGPVILRDGTVLGQHHGLWRYTLGQRKGLGIAYREPLYVLGKDMERNQLLVGPKNQTLATSCQTSPPNLLLPPQDWPQKTLVQTIYRQRPVPALVQVDTQGLHIVFSQPHPLPAPGQIAAIYSEQGQVLAGAIITGAEHAS